jgi:putative Holliday junction resolvase
MLVMPEVHVLAFDYGKKRIGIALGNTLTQHASPLDTLQNSYDDRLWQSIDALITTWQPFLLVIGLPQYDDAPSPLESAIRGFAKQLAKRYDKPAVFINEAFSSYEAEQRLITQRKQGRKQKLNKMEIDAQAAAVIAESWLEQHGT